ncbi:MAG: hypothetical protein ACI81T_004421 [Bacteroidia bacterium]|jgi:hypothetical protein
MKNMYYKKLLFLLISVLLFGNAQANDDEASLFHFKHPNKKSITIPFKMVNNLIIIPLFINNSDTLHFILDTGVNKTIMTGLNFTGQLELNDFKKVQLSGLGGGETISAVVSKKNNITLGSSIGKNQEVYVLLDDIFHLSSSLGMNVHGLIGFSVFKNFVVEINYEQKKIVLHNPKKFNYKGKGERLPLSIERHKPYVEAMATQEDGKSIKVKMLIDTGASHAVSLYDYENGGIIIPQKSFRSFLGRGLNGDIHGNIGRIDRFKLGSYKLPKPVVSYPDKEDIAIALKLSDRSGSIGSDLLRRFRVFFDYANKEIIVRKSGIYKRKFHYNISGINVITPFPGIKYYSISHIRPNSLAELAGLKRGDDIIRLNGSSAKNFSMNDLISEFQGEGRKKIKLVVNRDGKIMKIHFELNDLI